VPDRPLDFFVSHAGTDREWAIWIAQQLTDAGYSVELDVWHWAAGMDFIDVTQRAMGRAARVLEVWTPEYFFGRWAQMEHRVGFAETQTRPGLLLPVVVRDCPDSAVPVLYRTLLRVELVGLGAAEARDVLLEAVKGPRPPESPVRFPGPDTPSVYGGGRTSCRPVGAGAASTGGASARGYPGRLPPVWNVPNREPFFTGREDVLAEMDARLARARQVALVAEDGEGGVGKTELAVEYAWRHAADFGLVWWVDAGSAGTREASLLELATLLGVSATGGVRTIVPALYAELARRADWLLVLDGVRDADQLAALRPPASGRLMVTSRADVLGEPAVERIVLGRFDRADSVELLQRRCPWLARTAADRIAEIVRDLPLALAQAGAFLARTGMAAEEYLPELARQAGNRGGTGEAGLAAAVAVGLDRLAALDPAAADLLDQLALLAAEPVPLTAAANDVVTSETAPVSGLVVSDPDTTWEIVSSLTGLGLASQDGTAIQLHGRVHDVIAGGMTEPRRAIVLGRVLRLLGTADPGDPAEPRSWPRYAALWPHMQAATAALAAAAEVVEAAAFRRLLHQFCRYLAFSGQPEASCELAEATYRRRRQQYGAEDGDTLRWATHLGVALGALGDHVQARNTLAAALERQRTVAGPDDADTLHTAECLGVTLTALGDGDAAHLLLMDTLDRRQRILGQDAVDTLQSATDLAVVLGMLGYREQARLVLEDALGRRRQVLGADHPDTLTTGHQLGLVLAGEDGFEATLVLADIAARRRRVLGGDHPDALASGHHLGLALAAVWDHRRAGEVLAETAARRGRALGPEHPDTLATCHHLGLALAESGDHHQAREVLEGTAVRRRHVLGADDPDTLATRHHLGLALAAIGEREAARTVLEDTLRRRRRVLGRSHPDTLDTERSMPARLAVLEAGPGPVRDGEVGGDDGVAG
jgi:hypothetical protein